MIAQTQPPTAPTPAAWSFFAPIDDFLDRLRAAGYEVDPAAPLLWLHHPTKPGQWIAAYGVREAAKEERTETNGPQKVSA